VCHWLAAVAQRWDPIFMHRLYFRTCRWRLTVWTTETFGPVAAVRSFDTEDEALRLANDSRRTRIVRYDSGSSPYVSCRESTRNRYCRCQRRHHFNLHCSFGGIKESGLGREGGAAGLQEYLETKYVFINY
jgi:acyl-CoA reductase-like NAD-dependent aldehyde dehydrogenase